MKEELIQKHYQIISSESQGFAGFQVSAELCADASIQFAIEQLEEVYKTCVAEIIYPMTDTGKAVNKRGAGRIIELKILELKNQLKP